MRTYNWNIVSKNIRQELKKAYPKCKFSVRIRKSTHTYGVTVSWTDGITKDLVKKITDKYTNNDSYTVVNGIEQVSFIDLNREISSETQNNTLSEMGKTEQDLPNVENDWNNEIYYEMMNIFNIRNYGEYANIENKDTEIVEEKVADKETDKVLNDMLESIGAKILNTVEVCGFKYNIVDIGNGQTEWIQAQM